MEKLPTAHRVAALSVALAAMAGLAACATVAERTTPAEDVAFGTTYGIGYHAGGPSHRGGFSMGRAADQRMSPVAGPHAPLMRLDED